MKPLIKNLLLLSALITSHVDAQTFRALHHFTGSDGANPVGGFILSGDTLYGTTAGGGSSGNGTVFAVKTDGTGFSILHNFTDGSIASFTGCCLIGSRCALDTSAPIRGTCGPGTCVARTLPACCP